MVSSFYSTVKRDKDTQDRAKIEERPVRLDWILFKWIVWKKSFGAQAKKLGLGRQ